MIAFSGDCMTCPRCAGLCYCPVYNPAAQKFTDDTCPRCDGSGEVDVPGPVETLAFCLVAIGVCLGSALTI